MYHFFDVELAQKYGCNEAIILTNILYWLQKNYENNKHIYDGRVWTYNSRKAFSGLFPYWSDKQIYRILQSLVEQGAVQTGNYNEDKRDRTLWYSVNDDLMGRCILPNGTTHCPKTDSPLSQNGQCILLYDTDNKQQIETTNRNILPPIIPLKGESPQKPKADFKKLADDFVATIEEDDWRELIAYWLDYKIDIKKPLKCQKSLSMFANRLKRESGGDIERARAFIDRAVSQGWQDIHPDAGKSYYEQKKDYEKREDERKTREWKAQEAERQRLAEKERQEAEQRRQRESEDYERKKAEWERRERLRIAEEERKKAEYERYREENDFPF